MKKYMKENKFNIIFILLIIGFSLFVTSFIKSDSDYFWHLSAGRYMVNFKTILTRDVFSWSVFNKYWMSHEWLFEVIIYIYKIIFRNYHLIIYAFINIFLMLYIIYRYNKKHIMNNKLFGVIYLFISIIMIPIISGRPHIISNLFILSSVLILMKFYDDRNSKLIYLLPIISLLWVNIHGGSSSLIYLFELLFIIVSLIDFSYEKIKSDRNLKNINKLILILVISILIQLINPHGLKMIFYPYQNMLDKTMILSITEWRSLSLNNIYDYPVFIYLLITLFILLFSKEKIRLIDFILFLIGVYFSLKSVRFLIYPYLINSSFIFRYIKKRKDDKYSDILFIFIAMFMIFIFIFRFNKTLENSNKLEISDKAIKVIKQVNPKRLFNTYHLGGELINNNIKVFIDGRADLYGKYNYKDNLNILSCNPNMYDLIDKYNFDYYLINKDYDIYGYLENSGKFLKIYDDEIIMIYKNN